MVGEKQLHIRWVSLLGLLSVGFMALGPACRPDEFLEDGCPRNAICDDFPNNTLIAHIGVTPDEIIAADGKVLVAMNQLAAEGPFAQPVELEVAISVPDRRAPRRGRVIGRLVTKSGEKIRMRPGFSRFLSDEEGSTAYVARWKVAPCSEACLQGATLELTKAKWIQREEISLSSELIYEEEFDVSLSQRIEIALGDRPQLISSSGLYSYTVHREGFLPSPTVYLNPQQPSIRQKLSLKAERVAIPVPIPGNSVELVWKGGSTQINASQDARGTLVFTPEGLDPVTVPFSDSDVSFEVPFVATCGQRFCVSDLKVEYRLNKGAWAFFAWSNTVPGLRTRESDEWFGEWSIELNGAPGR